MTSDSDAPPLATLYTRADCTLCERAAAILQRLAAEGLLRWQSVDIATNPALLAAYAETIPVIALADGPTFAGRISEFRLRRSILTIVDRR